jgi:hypothetical protein
MKSGITRSTELVIGIAHGKSREIRLSQNPSPLVQRLKRLSYRRRPVCHPIDEKLSVRKQFSNPNTVSETH